MVATRPYNDHMRKLTLRLPEELHAALKELAENENRSLNNQIVFILKRHIEQLEKSKSREDDG